MATLLVGLFCAGGIYPVFGNAIYEIPTGCWRVDFNILSAHWSRSPRLAVSPSRSIAFLAAVRYSGPAAIMLAALPWEPVVSFFEVVDSTARQAVNTTSQSNHQFPLMREGHAKPGFGSGVIPQSESHREHRSRHAEIQCGQRRIAVVAVLGTKCAITKPMLEYTGILHRQVHAPHIVAVSMLINLFQPPGTFDHSGPPPRGNLLFILWISANCSQL